MHSSIFTGNTAISNFLEHKGNMVHINKRFSLWKVFLSVVAINLFFTAIGYFIVTLEEKESLKAYPEYLIKHQLPGIVFATLFFYLTLNTFYHLLITKKGLLYFVAPVMLSIIAADAFYLSLDYFVPLNSNKGRSISFTEELVVYFTGGLFMTVLSFAVAYFGYLRDERKKKKILEQQKLQLEVEKAQAELNFLKAQVNPHFLHNTLNFLYAKALPLSAELSEGILTLSDVMRYALSDNTLQEGVVLLKDEIAHVRNVIKMNQLRFGNKLNVAFEVEGVVNGVTIVPFVLITLVENAFKHGDLKNPEYPIIIKLKVEDHQIHFCCKNKKKTGPKERSTGIGLDNIKKRLDLVYHNKYSLIIKDEADYYTTDLIIKSHD